jgi:hypothetical protein
VGFKCTTIFVEAYIIANIAPKHNVKVWPEGGASKSSK